MKPNTLIIIGLSLTLLLPPVTHGQEPWDVEQIFLATNQREVQLVDEQGNAVKSYKRDYIGNILSVWDDIQEVSSYRAALKFAPGKSPNAYAGKSNGEKIVAVNFGMIELLGNRFRCLGGYWDMKLRT